jgi:hypothetical protein
VGHRLIHRPVCGFTASVPELRHSQLKRGVGLAGDVIAALRLGKRGLWVSI